MIDRAEHCLEDRYEDLDNSLGNDPISNGGDARTAFPACAFGNEIAPEPGSSSSDAVIAYWGQYLFTAHVTQHANTGTESARLRNERPADARNLLFSLF